MTNLHQLTLRHHAVQLGYRIVIIDYRDVTSPHVFAPQWFLFTCLLTCWRQVREKALQRAAEDRATRWSARSTVSAMSWTTRLAVTVEVTVTTTTMTTTRTRSVALTAWRTRPSASCGSSPAVNSHPSKSPTTRRAQVKSLCTQSINQSVNFIDERVKNHWHHHKNKHKLRYTIKQIQ